MVLNIPEVWRLCSLKYFFTLSYEVCKERRRHKFYEIPDPPSNFDTIVWPQYLKYKAELENKDVTFVDTAANDESYALNVICDGLTKITSELKCELPCTEV